MRLNTINNLLLALLVVAVILLSEVLKEQEVHIDALQKEQGDLQMRLDVQLEMIRSIVEYLDERNARSSFVDARWAVGFAAKIWKGIRIYEQKFFPHVGY